MKVDYPNRSHAKIVEAYYQTPSTTDYNGIYRGKYNAGLIRDRVDVLSSFNRKNDVSEIETDDSANAESFDASADMHYIDVIAIIQELNF